MKKLLILAGIAMMAFSCQPKEKKNGTSSDAATLTPVAYQVVIEGMTCTGCEETVEGSVNKLEGIKMVDAKFTDGTAIVEYYSEKSDTALIRKAITGSGYKVIVFKKMEGTDPIN